MDGTGTGMGAPPANWTTNMDGTAGGTTAYASGVPDATSLLQVVALCILFSFPALALAVVSLRVAGGGRGASSDGVSLSSTLTSPFSFTCSLLTTPDDGLVVVAMLLSAIETAASYKC